MAEIINLRTVRKRLNRAASGKRAEQNRRLHGRIKIEHALQKARAKKADRDLEAHRRDHGAAE